MFSNKKSCLVICDLGMISYLAWCLVVRVAEKYVSKILDKTATRKAYDPLQKTWGLKSLLAFTTYLCLNRVGFESSYEFIPDSQV